MAFRLLVYHDMPAFAVERLREHGIEIKRGAQPTEAGICRDIVDCDGLVAFEQPEHGFNRTIMDAAPRLKLIAGGAWATNGGYGLRRRAWYLCDQYPGD